MKRAAAFLFALLFPLSACAWPAVPGIYGGVSSSGSSPAAPTFPCTFYSAQANGFQPCTNNKLIFTVFGQQPNGTSTASGTDAAAAVAIGAPIFFGESGSASYPENVGSDNGDMAAMKTAGAYFMPNGGFTSANSASNTTANVACTSAVNNLCTSANMINAATAASYTKFAGYDAGDEPACGSTGYNPGGTPNTTQPQQGAVPTAISNLHSYDATRPVMIGQGGWVGTFPYSGAFPCGSAIDQAAILAPDWVSFDYYPGTDQDNDASVLNAASVHITDGTSTPYDSAWATGRAVAQVVSWEVANSVQKPIVATIADGGDSLSADAFNIIHITTHGTNIVNINTGASPFSIFSTAMDLTPPGGTALNLVNFSCSDIPGSTTHFTSIDSTTQAHISAAATGSTTDCVVTLTGGTAAHSGSTTSCNSTNNLCASNGHAYRDSAVVVNAEMWGAIINGAQGIQFFCYDSTSSAFCLGATAGGSAATAVAANLTYITGVMNTYAPILNHTDSGKCSMQTLGNSINTSCSNGSLAMSTGTTGCIGQALLQYYPTDGHYYLFTMTDRDSSSIANSGCSTSGATFTWTLTGVPGSTATIVYDSNSHYDAGNDTTNGTKPITAGAFSDTLGDHSDGYRVKIYKI